MSRIYEPIAGVEGVAAGASATVKVPTNRRLHLLRLEASAVGPIYGTDVIEEVFAYVGSKLQRNVLAQELVDIANLNGRGLVGTTDAIPLFMSEPHRASVMDEQVTAWDLWGVGDCTLKVKIKAGVVSPVLAAIMAHDDGFSTNGNGQRILNIIRQMPFHYNAGTSFDITTLDVDKPIQRIYLYPEAGNTITSVKVVVNDSATVHDLTQAQNKEFLEDYDLVAETGAGKMYPLCADLEQQIFAAWPPLKSLRVTVRQSGAGAIKAVLENRATGYV